MMLCGREDSNLHWVSPQDPKSCASTNSATPARWPVGPPGFDPGTYRLRAGCSPRLS